MDDLRNIFNYISHDSRVVAKVFINRLYNSVDQLRKFPKSGRNVPEIADEKIRELIISNYRIVYRVNKEMIEILTVFYSRKQLDESKLSD
ncbi:MAG: type II toxin-antitoxin system RelE/ParE family toxin [Bacteroidota bacterium]